MKSFISFPRLNSLGDTILTANQQALGRIPLTYNDTFTETKDRYVPINKDDLLIIPFYVEPRKKQESQDWEIVVHKGYIYEYDSENAPEAIFHLPSNFDTEAKITFDPKLNPNGGEFAVGESSAIYVKVFLLPDGKIDPENPPEVILDEDPVPPVIPPPDPPDHILYYKLANISRNEAPPVPEEGLPDFQDPTATPAPTVTRHLAGSHICYVNNGVGSFGKDLHPFKVRHIFVPPPDPEIPDEEEPEPLEEGFGRYEVYTGIAGGIEIITQTIDVEHGHFIYVKTVRESSSRVVEEAVLESGENVPDSNYVDQFVAIAQVSYGQIIQHRFEDIRVSEILISEAGELRLISVFDTTNTYALP